MKKLLTRIIAAAAALGLLWTAALALTPEDLRTLMRQYYVDEVPEEVLAGETVEDILAALGDPYTEYLDGDEYVRFTSSMEDVKSVGLGVVATMREAKLVIETVLPGSAAQDAGLVAGESLINFNGIPTVLAYPWVMEAGKEYVFTVEGLDGSYRDVTVTAKDYIYPTAFVSKQEAGITFIDLNTYGMATYREVFEIMTDEDIVAETAGWVLDIRDNTGGNIYPAVWVPGALLGSGDPAIEAARGGIYILAADPEDLELEVYQKMMQVPEGAKEAYNRYGALTEEQVFVLVSKGSASASELTAAMAKRMGGVVIGERTFGKGVGQMVMDCANFPDMFTDDALKLTAIRIYTGGGTTTHVLGVVPNFVVPAELSDEVAALLASELDDGDRFQLGTPGGRVAITISVSSALEAPEAMAQVLAALPPTEEYTYNGEPVTVPELAEKLGVAYESRWFTDLDDVPEGEKINALATYGIVDGVGEGRYDPEGLLDRASFAALVTKAIGPRNPVKGWNDFADVDHEAWYDGYVSAVAEMGWMKGNEAGEFLPEGTLTHQEFFTVMTRILRTLSYQYGRAAAAPAEELRESYPGYAEWALEYLGQAEDYAWTQVSEIDPLGAVTREEAGVAMFNLLARLGAI